MRPKVTFPPSINSNIKLKAFAGKRKIQDDAEKAIKDDPKVKKIIEEFGAKVIESTVESRKSE